jgi:hypothetical protein
MGLALEHVDPTPQSDTDTDKQQWPKPPEAEAFCGLAGELVHAIEPASEADPVAVLVQFLAAFGNLIGRGAYFSVESDRHYANEYFCLVGKSSKARKGTSWGRVRGIFAAVDSKWLEERVQTGLSSGEGVIWGVRDPIYKSERIKERNKPVRYVKGQTDEGVSDKRLFISEPEFANVLRQIERQNNTLSAILRLAWDGGNKLQTLTKNSPAQATNAHISLVGHVTADELKRYLTTTEMANGFANRIGWTCVRRSKELPEGGHVDEKALTDISARLARAVNFAKNAGEICRDEKARGIWGEVYHELTSDSPGLAGAMTARAEAHVVRLSLLYALLDESPLIRAEHLLAALALTDYISRSVHYIFGNSMGDKLADELLSLLRAAPNGLSRNEITNLLGRHQSSDKTGKALEQLAERGLASCEQQETDGRPREVWRATKG